MKKLAYIAILVSIIMFVIIAFNVEYEPYFVLPLIMTLASSYHLTKK